MRYFFLFLFLYIFNVNGFSQGCCSGGAGSPIVGSASSGVLQEYQMELSFNYQANKSHQFLSGNVQSNSLFESLKTDYLFLRTDYGISEKLTLSIASGYYIRKELIESENVDTILSSGLSDLIIFPRYSVYSVNNDFKRTEIALGIGIKIPLGSHMDSSLTLLASSFAPGFPENDIYSLNPPSLQTTNGSHDFMFHSFFYRNYQKNKLSLFISTLYIKKSFNSLGINFGNYSSIGFFVSKIFVRKWMITTQIKAEKIGNIKSAQNIDLNGFYNIDPISTGSKKWFCIPQISYSSNGLTFFATGEIPIYQYLNGTQIGSENQFTLGINYRFLLKK